MSLSSAITFLDVLFLVYFTPLLFANVILLKKNLTCLNERIKKLKMTQWNPHMRKLFLSFPQIE